MRNRLVLGTKMNYLDLCSRQSLRRIRHWISRKPLEIEALIGYKKTTNRKWPMGNRIVTWPMTLRDPERSNS